MAHDHATTPGAVVGGEVGVASGSETASDGDMRPRAPAVRSKARVEREGVLPADAATECATIAPPPPAVATTAAVTAAAVPMPIGASTLVRSSVPRRVIAARMGRNGTAPRKLDPAS